MQYVIKKWISINRLTDIQQPNAYFLFENWMSENTDEERLHVPSLHLYAIELQTNKTHLFCLIGIR